MNGFRIQVATTTDMTGKRFNLYDNNEKVLTDIGVMDFQYLPEGEYTGVHTLALSVYNEDMPSNESDLYDFYSANFTKPVLENLNVTVTLL